MLNLTSDRDGLTSQRFRSGFDVSSGFAFGVIRNRMYRNPVARGRFKATPRKCTPPQPRQLQGPVTIHSGRKPTKSQLIRRQRAQSQRRSRSSPSAPVRAIHASIHDPWRCKIAVKREPPNHFTVNLRKFYCKM